MVLMIEKNASDIFMRVGSNVRARISTQVEVLIDEMMTFENMEKIIEEVAAARQTERGNRADDKRGETAMEDRKKEGYF